MTLTAMSGFNACDVASEAEANTIADVKMAVGMSIVWIPYPLGCNLKCTLH